MNQKERYRTKLRERFQHKPELKTHFATKLEKTESSILTKCGLYVNPKNSTENKEEVTCKLCKKEKK